MKKYLSVLVIAVFALVLTGCGEKKVKCTLTQGNVSYEITGYFKGGKYVKQVENAKAEFDTEEEAKKEYEESLKKADEGDVFKINGKKLTYTSTFKASSIEDKEEREAIESMTKEEFIEEYESEGFTCK